MRLNCLTADYSEIWKKLFDPKWAREQWAVDWPNLRDLGEGSPEWNMSVPLRTERERRSALVEIDALVAVWLGVRVNDLIAILRSRYPILADREDRMWFAEDGRRIAADPYAFGIDQPKSAYGQLVDYFENPATAVVPAGYQSPFYRADRENEYQHAHAVFSKRLQDAIDAGWEPS